LGTVIASVVTVATIPKLSAQRTGVLSSPLAAPPRVGERLLHPLPVDRVRLRGIRGAESGLRKHRRGPR
jgi:hypothetical protein